MHTSRFVRNSQFAYTLIMLIAAIMGPAIGHVQPAIAAPPGQGPPPGVVVIQVKEEAVNPPVEYAGRVEAVQAVDLRARVEGFIEKVAFQEGAVVKEGDLLYVIEQAPYQAAHDQARAGVAEAKALLRRTAQYLQRLQSVKSGGISASDLEAATSAHQQAEARLEEAEANLVKARLNLEYSTIYAPISGRIGPTAYTRGNLVGPSSGRLARIVQMDPIRVVYAMSETDLAEVKMAEKTSSTQNYLREKFVPRLRLPNGQTYSRDGRIAFIDNQMDPGTGTIAVRAVFDNPEEALLPGQYVTVLVSLKEARTRPLIPQSAVMEDRDGRYVFIVESDNTVQPRRIQTGAAVQDRWVVENGLSAGETIVVQGVQKAVPGQKVNPMPDQTSVKE